MLKFLVRVAGAAVAALLAIVAGFYMAAADLDALPASDYVASVNFDNSPLNSREITDSLNVYVDGHMLGLVRVAADPNDFLHARVAYAFGTDPDTGSVDWFSADMSGDIRESAELGSTPLSGIYGLTGSTDDADAWVRFVRDELRGEVHTAAKTPTQIMTYALMNVGAWVPISAALVLMCAAVLAWYVIRARGRELRLLGGMRLSAIAIGDFRSLLAALLPPAIVVSVLAVGGVALAGFGRIATFAVVLAVLLAGTIALTVLIAACTGALTLPDVRSMARRRPPERASWSMAEILKAGAAVVAAALVPFTVGMVGNASRSAELGTAWAAFDEAVTVRVGDGLVDGSGTPALAELVRRADARGDVFFSMSLTGTLLDLLDDTGEADLSTLGYDGVVLVNRDYLVAVLPALGPVARVGASHIPGLAWLPDSVQRGLVPTLSIWTQTEQPPAVELFDYRGDLPLPVFGGRSGYLDADTRPLVLVVEGMGTEFNDDFLASALSLGTVALADGRAVNNDAEDVGASPILLSVDRAADLGLAEVQSQMRTAQLGGVSLVVAVLALAVALAMTAWIYALLRRRRWFVERTAGASWLVVLRRRLIWEAVIALTAAAVAAAALAVVLPHAVAVAPAIAAAYLSASIGFHIGAGRAAFRATLARRG